MSDEKYGFLDEEVADEAVPEVQAESPAETVVTPAPPAPEVPTTPEPREETHVPLAALKAEREKRQRMEQELAYIRQQQQAQPEPDFYADPAQFVQQAVHQTRQQMAQVMYAGFEEHAREVHPDYDEVLAEVTEYAQANPTVIPQVFNSANPAITAYKLGKQLRAQKEMADPKAYRAKVEAEIRAQIKAETEAAEKQRATALAAIPPDLSAARSSRDQEVAEDDSLDSILASRKKR